MFKIGHGAYRGANSLAWADTKAQAVAILREKGVKRDVARAAVQYLTLLNAFTTIYGGSHGMQVIEVALLEERPAIDHQPARPIWRRILNQNPALALDLIADYKRRHGCAPFIDTIAAGILKVKMGCAPKPASRKEL